MGKAAYDKTGPILIPPTTRAGVFPQTNWVNLHAPGCGAKGPSVDFNASQHLYEARIDGSSGRLQSSSIMHANENTLITRLSCARCPARSQRVQLSLQISDFWKLPSAAGATATQLWTRHENNYNDVNPAALGSCDPHTVFVRGVSQFILRRGSLVVHNGTDDACPLLLPVGAVVGPWADSTRRLVVRGPCTAAAAKWTLAAAAGAAGAGGGSGEYVIRSSAEPALCLGTMAGSRDALAYAVGCTAHGAVLRWTASAEPASGQPFRLELRQGPPSGRSMGCLVSVAGNTNNTLAIVTEVRANGRAVQLDSPATDGRLTSSASFEMQAEYDYDVVTALISRRDLAEPGQYRYHHSTSAAAATTPDVVAAASHAAEAANASAMRIEHSAWWRRFWNASSVDLGPRRQTLEAWWYGMLYLLGSASRVGEVVPSLFGPWVIKDPPSWVDD
eukprot:SAG25_NODE_2207_length_1837_cov_1.774453_1_plen_445_part_10